MGNVPAKRRLLALAALASLAMVSACGSSGGSNNSSSGSGGGLPSQITVAVLAEKTGHAVFYGKQLIAGANAGIAEVKKLGILKGSTIKLDIRDTATAPETAATRVSDVARTSAVAILGPDVSNEGLTAGPVAQQSKIVEMFGTSAPGILAPGDYLWSMTTPQDQQLQPIVDNAKKQGFSSVGIIYEEDIASQKEMNTKIQSMLKTAGIKVAVDTPVESTATDFSSAATKVAGSGVPAVITIGGSALMPNTAKALVTAGFKGQQYGTGGAGGNVETLGAQADGYRYVTEWAPGAGGQDGAEFQKIFKQTNPGVTPFYPAVDGYTMTLFLAHALADAKSTDRGAVLAGLQKIAAAGFDGPAGKVTFPTARQMVLPTTLVQLKDGKATPVH